MRYGHPVLLAAAFALAVPRAVSAQGGLVVEIAGREHVVAPTALDSLATDTVSAGTHGRAPRTFVGVSFNRLMEHLGVESRGLRGAELARYTVFEAADGYRAVLGAAELDPSVTGRTVLLAREVDGRPLSDAAGPWQLVVSGDERAARWVRQVRVIRLVSLPDTAG